MGPDPEKLDLRPWSAPSHTSRRENLVREIGHIKSLFLPSAQRFNLADLNIISGRGFCICPNSPRSIVSIYVSMYFDSITDLRYPVETLHRLELTLSVSDVAVLLSAPSAR